MILTDLKKYIQQRKLATLQDMAFHFKMDTETIRPMLSKWQAKGKIRRHANNSGCAKGCCQCDSATIETYEWLT